MSKKKLSKKAIIPEPCHENWDNMDVVEKGRFCHSCEKIVHDVSSFSDKHLVDFLDKNENACVQMLPSQTNRDLNPQVYSPLLSRAAIALGVISLTVAGTSYGQHQKTRGAVAYVKKEVPIEKDTVSHEVMLQGEVQSVRMIEIELTGTILDEKGNPINEVRMVFPNDKIINTNKLGKYKVKIEVDANKKFELKFKRSGFYSQVVYVDPKSNSKLNFKMKYAHVKGKVKIN